MDVSLFIENRIFRDDRPIKNGDVPQLFQAFLEDKSSINPIQIHWIYKDVVPDGINSPLMGMIGYNYPLSTMKIIH